MLVTASQLNDPMQKEIKKLFEGRDDAFAFICLYVEYVHCIDDCVDEEKCVDRISNLTRLAALVFNSNYWRKYSANLYLVERLTHSEYFDSVEWELSKDTWKKRDSKVMNQCGYNMIFAVVLIEFGEEKLKEFSLRFREYSHKNQGHHEC